MLLTTVHEQGRRSARLLEKLQQARSIEELIIGWVDDRRTLRLTRQPTTGIGEQVRPFRLDIEFRSGQMVSGEGTLDVDSFLSLLPPLCCPTPAVAGRDYQGETLELPTDEWFSSRDAAYRIDIQSDDAASRCAPLYIAPLILSYLVDLSGSCTISESARIEHYDIELMHISAEVMQANAHVPERPVGWKEVFQLSAPELAEFVPHAFWT